MKFRETLKDELIFKDLQSKELAAKTGISLHTINHYLTQNGNSPSAENAYKIAQVLGVTVEYLVTGKDTELSMQIKPQVRDLIAQLNTLEDRDLLLIKEFVNRLKKD